MKIFHLFINMTSCDFDDYKEYHATKKEAYDEAVAVTNRAVRTNKRVGCEAIQIHRKNR